MHTEKNIGTEKHKFALTAQRERERNRDREKKDIEENRETQRDIYKKVERHTSRHTVDTETHKKRHIWTQRST